MATRDIVPRYDGVGDFGTTSRKWRKIYCNAVVFDDGTEMTTATITVNTLGQVFDTGWIVTPSPGSTYSGAHGFTGLPKHCTIWARPNNGDYNGYAYDGFPENERDDFIISEFQHGSSDAYGFCIKFDTNNYYITVADNGSDDIFKHLQGNDSGNEGAIDWFRYQEVDVKFIFIA